MKRLNDDTHYYSSEDEDCLLAGLTHQWAENTLDNNNHHSTQHNNINNTDNIGATEAAAAEVLTVKEIGYRSRLNPELLIYILSSRVQGIAFQLWPAAAILCQFIESHRDQFKEQTIVELGSGCGLVGLLCASTVIQAQKTYITDMQSVQAHLQANIQANQAIIPNQNAEKHIEAATIEWGKPLSSQLLSEMKQIDYILLSDCVYWEELFEPLLLTLLEFTQFSPKCVIYLTQTPRRGKIENRFFKKVKKQFNCEVIHKQKETEQSRQFIQIYKITRKS
jgi:predicted nicotinamide N-methyase